MFKTFKNCFSLGIVLKNIIILILIFCTSLYGHEQGSMSILIKVLLLLLAHLAIDIDITWVVWLWMCRPAHWGGIPSLLPKKRLKAWKLKEVKVSMMEETNLYYLTFFSFFHWLNFKFCCNFLYVSLNLVMRSIFWWVFVCRLILTPSNPQIGWCYGLKIMI